MINRGSIKYRVGTFKDTGKKQFATFLIYIDARTAEDELDKEFKMFNWQFRWEQVEGQKWAVKGFLKVRQGTDAEWITREDVGYPQEMKRKKGIDDSEWLKDAVSDALKRCAVQFGIGRELYSAPFLYTEEVNCYQGKDGKSRLNSYKPLTDMGKKMIEGNIDKWYNNLTKE